MIWHCRNHFEKNKSFKKWLVAFLVAVILLGFAGVGSVIYFKESLKPVSQTPQAKEITIMPGMSVQAIAQQLKTNGLIRQGWAFELDVKIKGAQRYLQAGTYTLSPSQSTSSIISQLTHGKVSLELVIILPGQRLDQIRQSLIDQGFDEASVDAALEPTQYESLAILADKPTGASLEGYLYPESFEKDINTTATDIIRQSIMQFDRHLTDERRTKYANQGLTVYQAITLASIVEKEVVTPSDKAQAAQVFIKRLSDGMKLGSDVTAFYGSELAGVEPSVNFDSSYNTRMYTGLPPTPISNISESSLDAVADPADTDWLFFVAGDDGTTYFSRTFEEHQQLVNKYCIKLCQ